MTALRPGLPSLPTRMRFLPVSPHGYPVPFFVAAVNGAWDFRVADPAKWTLCVRQELCWVCGQPLGVFRTFVLGPVAALNRISAEPPSHLDCAEFAARACPFLLLPKARRREVDGATVAPGGQPLGHNPGVCALWSSKTGRPLTGAGTGLFDVGAPTTVRWYSQGREATREEVIEALDAGLQRMRDTRPPADGEWDEIMRRYANLTPLLPRAAA